MATNPNSSLHPWELRDQRFLESQAKAAGDARDNGRAEGPASLPPLLNYNQTEGEMRAEQLASDIAKRGQSAADPSLARRGLTHAAKALMIEMFAQFQSVSQVGDALQKEFGLKLDRRTIESFNPDSTRCRIGKRLKSLFDLHRKAYVEETAKVAVAHQAHRLRLLGTIVDKATTAKDFGNAIKGLELAAKEMGGLSQTVEHKGMVAHIHGTVEDARKELAERLKGLIPAIDVVPSKLTEDERKLTEGEDHGQHNQLQALPAPPPATRPLHMDNSDGQSDDARREADSANS